MNVGSVDFLLGAERDKWRAILRFYSRHGSNGAAWDARSAGRDSRRKIRERTVAAAPNQSWKHI